MSDDIKHLWECGHPYYCSEGNYLASPVRNADLDCWEEHASWASFIEDWGSSDPDMNLFFRWDWHAWHLEYPEEYPEEKHELKLFVMLQRKAFNKSITIAVTEADEPAIREWLQQRAKTVAAIWEPFLEAEPEGVIA